jgi:K+-transporting ATPase ATPase C chain
MNFTNLVRQHWAALRALLVLTTILGIAYPVFIWLVAQIPGLRDNANGSIIEADGEPVGSSLIGQTFTDSDGNPLPQYFQGRPSAAGDGYDTLATSASNLGPESIVDTLAANPDDASQSLLTQVCARSAAIGRLEGVDGSRPYCTPDGVGAVLRVFYTDGQTGTVTRAVSVNQAAPATPFLASYQGVTVEAGKPGEDYSGGVLVAIRGDAPASPAVPSDAVTASGSGLDPQISTAYAELQVARVARERGADPAAVRELVEENTVGRSLGFMGEPGVNVLKLNLALDRELPAR